LLWDVPGPESVIPNLDGVYHGPVRARTALQGDYLAPAQSVLEQMGLAAVMQTMQPFGLQLNDTRDFAALLDGQNLVSPLAMARAYGVFAANGALVEQTSALLEVRTVEGLTIWQARPAPVSALVSPQLSYLMNHVLLDESLERPAARKLARNLDGSETWVIGYTPNRSIALWLGGESNPRAASGCSRRFSRPPARDSPPRAGRCRRVSHSSRSVTHPACCQPRPAPTWWWKSSLTDSSHCKPTLL
jgi:membrane peptidoglycan carboxypeptidase